MEDSGAVGQLARGVEGFQFGTRDSGGGLEISGVGGWLVVGGSG
jgi:hypothetical protein